MKEAELLSRRPSPSYTCAHLVVDVWKHETGKEILGLIAGDIGESRQDFVRVPHPVSPCIVLFRGAKAAPHIGVFLRGRVLHLTRRGPVRQLISVAALGYDSVRFYADR